MRTAILLIALGCAAGCAAGKAQQPAQKASDEGSAPRSEAESKTSKSKSSELKSGVQIDREADRAVTAAVEGKPLPKELKLAPDAMETSKTTERMFKPAGLRMLQDRLGKWLKLSAERQPPDKEQKNSKEQTDSKEQKNAASGTGDREAPPEPFTVDENGRFDAKTQAALRAFQKEQKLPETGLPDYETLRRLEIKPDEVFHQLPAPHEGS